MKYPNNNPIIPIEIETSSSAAEERMAARLAVRNGLRGKGGQRLPQLTSFSSSASSSSVATPFCFARIPAVELFSYVTAEEKEEKYDMGAAARKKKAQLAQEKRKAEAQAERKKKREEQQRADQLNKDLLEDSDNEEGESKTAEATLVSAEKLLDDTKSATVEGESDDDEVQQEPGAMEAEEDEEEELEDAIPPFWPEYRWVSLQEDKSLDSLPGRMFPGSLLLRLGLTSDDGARATHANWHREVVQKLVKLRET